MTSLEKPDLVTTNVRYRLPSVHPEGRKFALIAGAGLFLLGGKKGPFAECGGLFSKSECWGAVVNNGDEADTLLSISGEGFEDARVLGGLPQPEAVPLRVEGDELVAETGGLRYPVTNGIPQMIIEEAKLPEGVASLDELLALANDTAEIAAVGEAAANEVMAELKQRLVRQLQVIFLGAAHWQSDKAQPMPLDAATT